MRLQAPILLLLLALAGCDGHVRVLYLTPPGSARPPWSVAAVVIVVRGDEDVPGIVARTAADLGLTPVAGERQRWFLPYPGKRGEFQMTLAREEGGYWSIGLLDWPSIARSDSSVNAEAAIRRALGAGRASNRTGVAGWHGLTPAFATGEAVRGVSVSERTSARPALPRR